MPILKAVPRVWIIQGRPPVGTQSVLMGKMASGDRNWLPPSPGHYLGLLDRSCKLPAFRVGRVCEHLGDLPGLPSMG